MPENKRTETRRQNQLLLQAKFLYDAQFSDEKEIKGIDELKSNSIQLLHVFPSDWWLYNGSFYKIAII